MLILGDIGLGDLLFPPPPLIVPTEGDLLIDPLDGDLTIEPTDGDLAIGGDPVSDKLEKLPYVIPLSSIGIGDRGYTLLPI